MSQDSLPYAYKGEALLLRWGQNQKGRTVTLQLDPHVGVTHPFEGIKCGENGQRLQMACVLVVDDEEPVSPPAKAKGNGPDHVASRDPSETSVVRPHAEPAKDQDRPRTPFRDKKRAAQAALKLQDDAFCNWLENNYEHIAVSADSHDAILKEVLGISSKKELDTSEAAGEAWDRMLTTFTYGGI